ncbi:MAG: hypothetical protein ACXW2T_09965 [Allosphingosinicella sp.]
MSKEHDLQAPAGHHGANGLCRAAPQPSILLAGCGGGGFFGPRAVSGLVGYQTSSDDFYNTWNGFSEYWYYNAGLALVVEKLTFDFRYWGTDASSATSDIATCINGYCDSRFVFTAKVAVP